MSYDECDRKGPGSGSICNPFATARVILFRVEFGPGLVGAASSHVCGRRAGHMRTASVEMHTLVDRQAYVGPQRADTVFSGLQGKLMSITNTLPHIVCNQVQKEWLGRLNG